MLFQGYPVHRLKLRQMKEKETWFAHCFPEPFLDLVLVSLTKELHSLGGNVSDLDVCFCLSLRARAKN